MPDTIMEVWDIRPALTTGKIVKRRVTRASETEKYVYTLERWQTQLVLGKDAFETLADALVAAEKRRGAKIASLERSADKVRKIQFVEMDDVDGQ